LEPSTKIRSKSQSQSSPEHNHKSLPGRFSGSACEVKEQHKLIPCQTRLQARLLRWTVACMVDHQGRHINLVQQALQFGPCTPVHYQISARLLNPACSKYPAVKETELSNIAATHQLRHQVTTTLDHFHLPYDRHHFVRAQDAHLVHL